MNKELEQSLARFIDIFISAIEATAELGAGQTPLYIQELLTYRMWMHAFGLFISLSLIVILAFIGVRTVKWFRNRNRDNNLDIIMAVVGGGVYLTMLIFIFTAFEDASKVLKIIIAPRVYLLDYLKSETK